MTARDERDAIRVDYLWCPWCAKRHVDEGEWATRRHHTHQCVDDAAGLGCGGEWSLAVYVAGCAEPDEHPGGWDGVDVRQAEVDPCPTCCGTGWSTGVYASDALPRDAFKCKDCKGTGRTVKP